MQESLRGISKNWTYEHPCCVTGTSLQAGPEQRPTDEYGLIDIMELGKVSSRFMLSNKIIC